MDKITELRRRLHRAPEVSGAEAGTAAIVAEFLADYPCKVTTGLGGHGVIAVFDSGVPGPTVMIRAELDALPITQDSQAPWRSTVPGVAHLCGHDGHMAMVAALAPRLAAQPVARGRVILLFQPAEETGQGALAMLGDRCLPQADLVLALHNLPGVPLGQVRLCRGPTCCASQGVKIAMTGWTSHAADPGSGRSPAGALARLIPALDALGPGGAMGPDFALTTVTHAHLGEACFGIAPGAAEVWVTLRTRDDAAMADLHARAVALATDICASEGVDCAISVHEAFAAVVNDAGAADSIARACAAMDVPCADDPAPQLFSEDFGQFAALGPTAIFWLGAGEDCPALHTPRYDFPEALLPIGTGIFETAVRAALA